MRLRLFTSYKIQLLTSEHEKAGWTALHVAVRNGDIEQIKYCFTAYLNDLNKPVKTGETALHFAVKMNKFGMAKELLRYKADSNIQD